MTWRFSCSLFVIPNLFRDLGFGFQNLGFKARPAGGGSLLGSSSTFVFKLSNGAFQNSEVAEKVIISQAAQKCPDARLPRS